MSERWARLRDCARWQIGRSREASSSARGHAGQNRTGQRALACHLLPVAQSNQRKRSKAMASQHLILRTVCSGGGGDHVPTEPPQADDRDQQEPSPSTASSAHRRPAQQQQRRRPGQKVGRAPPTGAATSSTSAAAIKQSLESLPIWCDVTVLSEVASVAGERNNHNNNENANARTIQSSNDDGTTGVAGGSNADDNGNIEFKSSNNANANSDAPHVVTRQRFNPCGIDNVLVFPSSSSSSGSTISKSTSHLLRLSSCWTSSSLLSPGDDEGNNHGGGGDKSKSDAGAIPTKEEGGTNGTNEGLELMLDLPVRPHPATLAFVTSTETSANASDGMFAAGSGNKLGSATSSSTGTALLAVEFDLRPSYKALEGIVAKKEHERRRMEDDDKAKVDTERSTSIKRFMWNPLSSWWYPNGGFGGGNNISGAGIPTDRVELERMLDEMLMERLHSAKRQQQFEVGGSSTPISPTPLHGREDLLILQAAMDREIRDLNIMLSGLGLMGLALVGSYIYTVRRIWIRRPTSASSSGTATPEQQKRQRTSSAASPDAHSRGFGDGVRVPPPISTIQIVRDTVVQGLGMANIGDALKAAVGAGVASASASFSPSKSDGESVSTAPSTPETPSPRAKKQGGQHRHQSKKQELKGKRESPQEAAEPALAEKKTQISPERKEIINALLARVKAPTPVKPAEDEGGENNTTAGEKKMPTAVMATPDKNPAVVGAKQKQTDGKANEENNAPITPVPTRKPMVGRKPVGGTVGAFTSVVDDESNTTATPAALNMTPDSFAPTSRASAIDIGGILGGSSSAVVLKTPTLTPMRNKEDGGGGGSSKKGQSKSNAISADPRGSPSFAEMLVQKQQQLTPPKEEPSRQPVIQGNIGVGGSQKEKMKPRQQKKQQAKTRRKLTPPPKSKAEDVSAPAASGGFEDGSGNDTMIQGRNINDAIENTFFRDYWDE